MNRAQKDSDERHVDGFIEGFLTAPWKDRWKTILAMPEKKWSGIDLAAIGNPGRARPGAVRQLRETEDPAALPDLDHHLDDDVVVIRLGHDAHPGITRESLRRLIDGSIPILEGVVSIEPGRLALVFDHEGNIYLCKRNA